MHFFLLVGLVGTGIHFFLGLPGKLGLRFKKKSSFADREDNLLLIPAGRFLTIEGGWLESLWTYFGVSFGLMKGLYSPSLKSRETSRKSTAFLFASIVMDRKTARISFLIFSSCLSV